VPDERLGWPDIVPIEADVLPAERCDIGEELIWQVGIATVAALLNGSAEINCVPKDDGRNRQVET
jgi:hypothetical protein